jgi:hypothetical protein
MAIRGSYGRRRRLGKLQLARREGVVERGAQGGVCDAWLAPPGWHRPPAPQGVLTRGESGLAEALPVLQDTVQQRGEIGVPSLVGVFEIGEACILQAGVMIGWPREEREKPPDRLGNPRRIHQGDFIPVERANHVAIRSPATVHQF